MENPPTTTSNVNSEMSANVTSISDSEDSDHPRRVEGEQTQTTIEQPHSNMNGSSTHHEQIGPDFEVHDVRSDKDEMVTPESPFDIGLEEGSASEALGAAVPYRSDDLVEEHEKFDMLSGSSTDAISQEPVNTSKEVVEGLVTGDIATSELTEEKDSTTLPGEANIVCGNETFEETQPQTESCAYSENEILSATDSLTENSQLLQNEENAEVKTDFITPLTEKDTDSIFMSSEQQEANPDSPVKPTYFLGEHTNMPSKLISKTDGEPLYEEVAITDGDQRESLFGSEFTAPTDASQLNTETLSSLGEPELPTEPSQPIEQAGISNGAKTSENLIVDVEPSPVNLVSEVHPGEESEIQPASVHEINSEFLTADQKEIGFVYAKKETETINLESVQESVGHSNECIAFELAPSPISTQMITSGPPEVLAAYESSSPELRESTTLPGVPVTEHLDERTYPEKSPTEMSDVELSKKEQTYEGAKGNSVENEHVHQAEQHITQESVQPELCDQIPEENFKVAEVSSTEEPSLITTEHVVFSELPNEESPVPQNVKTESKSVNVYQHPGDENQLPNGYERKSNGPIGPVQRELSEDIQRRPLSDIKQRSKTLEPHIMASWMDHYLDPKKRSATLGRNEYRRRPKLQPKPAPNDDHLYPDSVTPSKVDRGLSVRSMSIGLPEGTYDVPYIDDDAFLPRKLRTVQNNHTNSSEDSEVSSENTIDWFWQSNGTRNSYLDPAHIADTNECVPTPVLIQKVERKPGKQKKKGDQHLMDEKHGNDPKRKRTFKLCSCVGKQGRS
ncbi:hypothetical protein P879_10247 [Paragonimus westermani]|uniref:Uncharacterized protein n=1 Tax=Paragonimus westermani TaxID=34504 RepID=A0A8T0D1S1_9TREM|nr:hypothetical protein P879_10247 [Paragonimus westermani]